MGRHIGPNKQETEEMLEIIGVASLDELINKTVPKDIRMEKTLDVAGPISEHQYLSELNKTASKNKVFKNYIGQGYYDTITPSVILRNLLKTPGGIPNTRLIRLRFHKGGLKVFSTFKLWQAI